MLRSKLLERQIRKYLNGISIPESMSRFLTIVDDAYHHYEHILNLLERALDLSARELNDA